MYNRKLFGILYEVLNIVLCGGMYVHVLKTWNDNLTQQIMVRELSASKSSYINPVVYPSSTIKFPQANIKCMQIEIIIKQPTTKYLFNIT